MHPNYNRAIRKKKPETVSKVKNTICKLQIEHISDLCNKYIWK